jgi:hypothetical protein
MLQDEDAARLLDIEDQIRRTVDAALLAHEGDGLFLLDRDAAHERGPRLQA